MENYSYIKTDGPSPPLPTIKTVGGIPLESVRTEWGDDLTDKECQDYLIWVLFGNEASDIPERIKLRMKAKRDKKSSY